MTLVLTLLVALVCIILLAKLTHTTTDIKELTNGRFAPTHNGNPIRLSTGGVAEYTDGFYSDNTFMTKEYAEHYLANWKKYRGIK